jgi:hypothetical protein
MSTVKYFQEEAKEATSNQNCVRGWVALRMHLKRNPGDFRGSMKEASYELDLSDEQEFKKMVAQINANKAVIQPEEVAPKLNAMKW